MHYEKSLTRKKDNRERVQDEKEQHVKTATGKKCINTKELPHDKSAI